ncbi:MULTISPECIES: hypothetical protein [unclassified Mesorhizobium]|uniref:hypothetical protein n=2 Tax=unclassified Mesorhizobium TaxID=325217 RepID=UPI0033391238
MKTLVLATALMSATLISGCTTSKTDFQNGQVALSGSPALKRQAIQRCMTKFKMRFGKVERANLAALMNVPDAGLEHTFCTRLMNGFANGRINYSDYLAALSHGDMSNAIKVLQGR